jgi:hypothetical protein
MRVKHLIFLCFFALSLSGQTGFNPQRGFAFNYDQSIPLIENGVNLPLAWVGGINFGSFANLDLNQDGVLDMVVFDKSGKRLLPFTATVQGNNIDYAYAPEYADAFPAIDHWIISKDFNCDGKLDLFIGYSQRIQVYENVSSGVELAFQKAHTSDFLRTTFFAGSGDIPSAATDIPAIIDLDDNGRIDILTVEASGGISVYKNSANCGLNYSLEGICWGKFREGGLANDVYLDSCTYSTTAKRDANNKTMHSGGAILSLDLNDDGLKDLLLSDVSFGSVVAMINGGTPDSAVMVSKTVNYPTAHPVDIYLYPGMYYADATGDGVNDLIITPNEVGINQTSGGAITGSENVNNIQLYKNTGTNTNPNFNYIKNNLLQENMIDMGEGAIPRFVDLNGDSLQDLILANDGEFISPAVYSTYLRYYANTGTKDSAAFTLVDADFAQMSSFNIGRAIVPTFGDLDGDGDQDMIVGAEDGLIHYFKNTGSATAPNYILQTPGLGSIDVGSNAAPFLFDFNQDGTLDLVIGTRDGVLFYYTNSSTTTPTFSLASSKLGGIRTVPTFGGTGHSIPYAFRDSTGLINLMVGSSYDGIWQYDSIGTQIGATSGAVFSLGSDSLFSANYLETPFGTKKRSGRNQFIFTAQELKNAGIGFGYINSIEFFVEVHPSLFPPYVMPKGFNIAMKNSGTNDLSGGFESNLQTVVPTLRYALNNGWNSIPLTDPFLYDGTSNLVVEICFSANNPLNYDLGVQMSDVGFPAHAYGDANKNGFNTGTSNGCAMPWEATTSKRPNVKFDVSPAFANTNRFLHVGSFTAPAFADLNNDGYIDAMIGNNAGGVQFFSGKKYDSDIGLEEPSLQTKSFSVYPNPSSEVFYIKKETAELSSLKVFNLSGQLVLTQDIRQQQASVSLAAFPQGMYLFVLQTGNGVETVKVIKQGY